MRTLRCKNASPFGKNAFDTITLKSIKSYKKQVKKSRYLAYLNHAAQNGKIRDGILTKQRRSGVVEWHVTR